MKPALKSPSLIEIKEINNCSFDDVEVGNIVVFYSKGYDRCGVHQWYHTLLTNRIVHRIIKKTKEFAVIKGDNSCYEERVLYKKIIGKVIQ